MALYKLDNYTKHGFLRSRIIPWEDGKEFSINPKRYGGYVDVRRFKYEYTHPQISPRLYTSHQNGKKYIIPTWQEVLHETTLNDIEWVKPKITQEKQIEGVWEFESSSSKGKFYSVKQNGLKFTCNCPGFWVAKDREKGCKHIQLVKKQLKK
jgi:hypothetical protein